LFYVTANHLISSFVLCPSNTSKLILETYRSRALSTKYNSSPQEASRPFDSGRDGFVWV
jgi:3-oxoacyl-(acyl-carrier-protein) synthase